MSFGGNGYQQGSYNTGSTGGFSTSTGYNSTNQYTTPIGYNSSSTQPSSGYSTSGYNSFSNTQPSGSTGYSTASGQNGTSAQTGSSGYDGSNNYSQFGFSQPFTTSSKPKSQNNYNYGKNQSGGFNTNNGASNNYSQGKNTNYSQSGKASGSGGKVKSGGNKRDDWFRNDSYGENYDVGYDDGSWNSGPADNWGGYDEFYNGPFPPFPPFPPMFRGRGNFRGRNPFRGNLRGWRGQRGGGGRGGMMNPFKWERGMPYMKPKKWYPGGVKQSGTFKKKAQGDKAVTDGKTGEISKRKLKKKVNNAQRIARFKDLMNLKNKYRSVRQNRNLTPPEQLVLVFLKRVAFDACADGTLAENVHCINFSKLASRHPNALKIYTYECKQQLDKKYNLNDEEQKTKRLEYLKEAKEDVMKGFKQVYKQRAASEDMEAKEKLMAEYEHLLGEGFTAEHIPTESDYLFKADHSRTEEQFLVELKYDFIFNAFEVFKFKPDEHKTPTRDIAKRVKFHLENPLIPFFIVESVRAKGLIGYAQLPAPVNKYIFEQSKVHQEKNEKCMKDVLTVCEEQQEMVKTPIGRYIGLESEFGLEVFRDMADCILLFDKFASYIRFRIVKYTPHLLLPAQKKLALFDTLLDNVYKETLDILVNKRTIETYPFVDIVPDPMKEGEEEKEEGKVEESESMEEE